MKFRAKIINGKLDFTASRQWVKMKISSLVDGDYDITITRYFDKRSNKQNKYYWGCVIPIIFEGLRDAGFEDVKDLEDVHEILKQMFWKKQIYSEKNDALEMTLSSTQFSNEEFMTKIEHEIVPWAFMFLGVTIPPPNSQAAMDL